MVWPTAAESLGDSFDTSSAPLELRAILSEHWGFSTACKVEPEQEPELASIPVPPPTLKEEPAPAVVEAPATPRKETAVFESPPRVPRKRLARYPEENKGKTRPVPFSMAKPPVSAPLRRSARIKARKGQ